MGNTEMKNYDAIIIGAGPAGYTAAFRIAQLGKTVALVEKDRVGGTCLNRGCIPTKTLMHSANLFTEIKAAEEMGLKVSDVEMDFEKLNARKDEVVEKLVSGIESLIKSNKVDYYQGVASVSGENTVKVEGDESLEITGEHILIAAGSAPARPLIPGLELPGVFTSDELLKSGEESKKLLQLRSVAIIGGGVIGIEIASIYSALGAEVTIIEAESKILPQLNDKEISQSISMVLKKKGVVINTGGMVKSVEKTDGGFKVNYMYKDNEESLEVEGVLVAIGRKQVAVEGADVSTPEAAQAIPKNFHFIGESGGSIQLAHAAMKHAEHIVDGVFAGGPFGSRTVVPSCIYTDPEIATAGFTEGEAKELGIQCVIGKAITGANGKTLIENGERGFVRLVFNKENRVLVGAQLVGKRSTDMIGGLAAAIASDVTLEELLRVAWPHPTFSEMIGEAAESARIKMTK